MKIQTKAETPPHELEYFQQRHPWCKIALFFFVNQTQTSSEGTFIVPATGGIFQDETGYFLFLFNLTAPYNMERCVMVKTRLMRLMWSMILPPLLMDFFP